MTTLSFWEKQHWFDNTTHVVIGSGIVGLSCAISLKEKYPNGRILVLERGMLPSGASTKNAGFACFGSCSELLDDLRSHSEQEVLDLVNMRIQGLQALKKLVGKDDVGWDQCGGYEVFNQEHKRLYEETLQKVPEINALLKNSVLDEKETFLVKNASKSLKNCQKYVIFNPFEGQLDPGLLIRSLMSHARKKGIDILTSAEVTKLKQESNRIWVELNGSFSFNPGKVFVATNGFARNLLDADVQPARAQVLITAPVPGLRLKGTFHMDRGYYYFRNVGNRILLGGGRNLDPLTEQTTQQGTTSLIQDELERMLSTTILPGTAFKIESRWSGTMGIGGQKRPVVKKLGENLFCGVRLGGMGVAIGCLVGAQLAALSEQS